MKKPNFYTRLLIVALVLYLGKETGVLLGFCVGIPCVTWACWKLFMDGWRDEEDE